jgi:hypothetical protein
MRVALEMKAVTISRYGDQSVLTYAHIERPKPKSDEILTHNYAAAVNPVDWKIRDGLGEMLGLRLPIVLERHFGAIICNAKSRRMFSNNRNATIQRKSGEIWCPRLDDRRTTKRAAITRNKSVDRRG